MLRQQLRGHFFAHLSTALGEAVSISITTIPGIVNLRRGRGCGMSSSRDYSTTARPKPAGFVGSENIPDSYPILRIPHDLGAESSVLGSCIVSPVEIGTVRQRLPKGDEFFNEANQIIYRILCEFDDANKPMDATILFSTLKNRGLIEQIGGMDYIKELICAAPGADAVAHRHAEYFSGIVADKALKRTLITQGAITINLCQNDELSAHEIYEAHEAHLLKEFVSESPQSVVPVSETVQVVAERMFKERKRGQIGGISTGLIEIDNQLDGLHPGDYVVIAARPSVGKTSLACNWAEHIATELHQPVAIFSLEMSKEQLIERMVCSRAMVDSHRARTGYTNADERHRLGSALGELSSFDNHLVIDDTPAITLIHLRNSLRRLVTHKNIAVAFVDYLQLMDPPKKGENRQQDISTISRGIKALAKELNIAIVMLSQLNRDSERERRSPRISDLRESGSIEQDADVVILLHREEVMYRGDQDWRNNNQDKLNLAEAIIGKNRNGPCENVKLTYIAQYMKFQTCNPGRV